MRAAILSIGTELTRGELTNTNASWLATRLTELGFEVTRIDCCDDDIPRIGESLSTLVRDHGVIVSTGGLGPTTDDLTTEAFAKHAGVPLVRDEKQLEELEEKFRRFGRAMAENNKKQADFPKGSSVLPNPYGTAPGFEIALGKARAFVMPGVPREMKPMFDDQVVPRIQALSPRQSHQHRFVVLGKPESEVGLMLDGVEAAHPGVTIGYRAHFPEIEVKVLAKGSDEDDAKQRAEKASAVVRKILAPWIFGEGPGSVIDFAAQIFREKKLTLALAESCTGGLLSQLLTEQPASDYFIGAAVTYANSAKTTLLRVPNGLIEEHGAVSAPVAKAMAEGARHVFGSDLAVAITGIAGPTGGSAEKPVGLVHIALATAAGTTPHELQFRGDRFRIQRMAAYTALKIATTYARASR
ncbi:MAG: competence/damage-inducible protein A [Deltaproteobacteria bacterium]|nr:competence/damage-inducible protein A [Deltaproteobacteria bacterium]